MTVRSFPTAFIGLTGILALSALLPLPGADGRIAHLPSLCPFYALTGLPCPGCGLTRSFVCLGHGQFLQSLHWHPLGLALYGVCIGLWAVRGWEWVCRTPQPWQGPWTSTHWSTLGLLLLLGFGAVRIGWLWVHHAQWPG